VIDELQAAFPLDKVFGEIAQYSTKDKLLGLVDQKLQGVVEKLLGTVWTQINASNVGTFAKQLNGILTQIDTFKTTWYQKIQQAANQSFNLQASYAYTSATEDDALIDVDIDLTAQGGPALFEAAVHGKFKTVFLVPNSPALRVYHGVLTHQLTQSAQLQISVLGWQFTSLQQVVANTEIAIQTGPAGQIQVFTTAAAIKQRKQRTETHGSDKTTETTESDFLLRFVGETTLAQGSPDGPYLIQNINNMAAEYDLSYSDDKTAPEELLNYLSLAETVGLIPSTQDFAAELAKQFPQGLGKVTAQYVVTFDNDGVRDAFTAPVGTAAALAHSVTTGLIRAQLLHRNVTDNNVMIALAALDPTVRKVFVTQGWTAVRDGTWTVGVPAFLGGGQETLNPALNLLLVTLLQMEFAFAEGFAQLDALVKNAKTTGTPAPVDKLQALATSFVEKVADISDYGRINSMFAVFDALVHAGSNGKGYRNSTLILQIQAGDPKSMVTKYLSSGTPKVQAAPLALGAA